MVTALLEGPACAGFSPILRTFLVFTGEMWDTVQSVKAQSLSHPEASLNGSRGGEEIQSSAVQSRSHSSSSSLYSAVLFPFNSFIVS